MMLQRMLRHLRPPALALMGAVILMLVPHPVLASERTDNQPRVTNVDWVLDDEQMVVSYDLNGEPDSRYVVKLVLRRAGDPAYRIVPSHAFGDVGQGILAGKGKVIQWSIQSELGQLPEGEDFFVELMAEEADTIPWYLVVVGVAVSGATIYSLVQHGQEPATPEIAVLPSPPARP